MAKTNANETDEAYSFLRRGQFCGLSGSAGERALCPPVAGAMISALESSLRSMNDRQVLEGSWFGM